MGSQSYKHRTTGSRGGGGGGGGSGGGESYSSKDKSRSTTAEKDIQSLIKDKNFQFAAAVAIRTVMKVAGVDILYSAVVAATKGYEEAQKHGVESGIIKGATEFAVDQAVSMGTDLIASNAVSYASSTTGIALDDFGKEIVKDAISATLEQAISEAREGA